MTLATLNDVLKPALVGHYAVAGLVVLGWEDAQAYVQAAEEVGVAIILQAGPGCRRHMPVSILGKMFRVLAEQAKVPVVCHIDHAKTVAECVEGIESGFTSVMIDGSELELSANIALTQEVVALAHRQGISVEGEVGVVGYSGGGDSTATAPEEAARFERETKVDALAISVGNVHLQTEKAAVIDFAALKAIESVTRVPLVLHGGSGIDAEVRRQLSREHRVKKFNIGTELRMAFGKALHRHLSENSSAFDRLDILGGTIEPVRQSAVQVLKSFS